MNTGKTLFAQLMDFLPWTTFARYVARYGGQGCSHVQPRRTVPGHGLRPTAAATNISDETRCDAAYKAVMQCALVALLAAGYRPSANEPGHHQTMIQALPLTLGVSDEVWVVLDALRRQRNANDYTGQPITATAVAECLAQAKTLEKALLAHLRAQHPQLLVPA